MTTTTTTLTIFSVPGIIALCNLLKAFGVRGKWSMLASVLLGVCFGLLDAYVGGGDITGRAFVMAGSAGLITGLAAAGLYDLTNTKK